MGGQNTKRRAKHKAKLAKKLEQNLKATAAVEQAAPKAASTRVVSSAEQGVWPKIGTSSTTFFNRMNATLKRLQKPLGFLLLGNVAVGSYLLLTRQPYKPPENYTKETAAESAAAGLDQGRASVQTEKEEGAHEGPSNTSLVGSGGATLSTPGGTPIPMPSFASSDHHYRHESKHEAGSHTHRNHEHGGPSNTSLVGSGGATLSTPGGTPIPLYSQSMADHHLRKGEEGGPGAHGIGESAAQRGWRRQREREIELDQNGDPVTRSPSDDGADRLEANNEKSGGDKWSKQGVSGRFEEPTLDLALEQYRQGLLLKLEKRRKMVPLNKEEEAWIDQEKAMIKEHLRHLPKAS